MKKLYNIMQDGEPTKKLRHRYILRTLRKGVLGPFDLKTLSLNQIS